MADRHCSARQRLETRAGYGQPAARPCTSPGPGRSAGQLRMRAHAFGWRAHPTARRRCQGLRSQSAGRRRGAATACPGSLGTGRPARLCAWTAWRLPPQRARVSRGASMRWSHLRSQQYWKISKAHFPAFCRCIAVGRYSISAFNKICLTKRMCGFVSIEQSSRQSQIREDDWISAIKSDQDLVFVAHAQLRILQGTGLF